MPKTEYEEGLNVGLGIAVATVMELLPYYEASQLIHHFASMIVEDEPAESHEH